MIRSCDVCTADYEAKRANSRFCSDSCRKRNQRSPVKSTGKPAEPGAEGASSSVLDATRVELERAQRVDTALGQQALEIARRMGSPFETGSGVASLSRELRAVMSAALEGVQGALDPVDELRARRDRKRSG